MRAEWTEGEYFLETLKYNPGGPIRSDEKGRLLGVNVVVSRKTVPFIV